MNQNNLFRLARMNRVSLSIGIGGLILLMLFTFKQFDLGLSGGTGPLMSSPGMDSPGPSVGTRGMDSPGPSRPR